MRLNDEVDYAKTDREDLVARLMSAQTMSRFLLRAFDALLHYGVNFKSLPEWQDQTDLEDAAKLRPHYGQPKVIAWLVRLEHALSAAVRRKQFKLLSRVPDEPPRD